MIVKPRSSTLERWESSNPILRKNELAIAILPTGKKKYYIGDGEHNFKELSSKSPSLVLESRFTVYDATSPNHYVTYDANADINKLALAQSEVAKAVATIMKNKNLEF